MIQKKRKHLLHFKMIMILIFMMSGCSWFTGDAAIDKQQVESERKKLEQLNEMAEQVYHYVRQGQVEEARAFILKMSELVTHIRFAQFTSVDGMESLSETMIEAKKSLTAVQYSTDEAVLATAKLRLATDSLVHPEQPMWHSYYKNLLETGKQLQQSIMLHNQPQSERLFQELVRQYSVIRPAVRIQREPHEVHRMDAYLKFLSTNLTSSAAAQFEPILNELFHQATDTAYLQAVERPNPMLWTITIGMLIMTVLTYVGWKKYQAEKGLN